MSEEEPKPQNKSKRVGKGQRIDQQEEQEESSQHPNATSKTNHSVDSDEGTSDVTFHPTQLKAQNASTCSKKIKNIFIIIAVLAMLIITFYVVSSRSSPNKMHYRNSEALKTGENKPDKIIPKPTDKEMSMSTSHQSEKVVSSEQDETNWTYEEEIQKSRQKNNVVEVKEQVATKKWKTKVQRQVSKQIKQVKTQIPIVPVPENKQIKEVKNLVREDINEKVYQPTIGQPVESVPFNSTALDRRSWEEVQVYMNRLFKPYNDTDCQFIRFGDENDGGYVTCLNSIQNAKALINFGVQGRDWYGCHVTTKKKMLNLQYDCTNNVAPACSTNENNNRFKFVCIGDKTETRYGKDFITIKDIIDENKLTKQHIWMKIDIEGGQWEGFKSLPLEYLEYIDQIVMEVHIGNRFPSSSMWGNLEIIENLMEYYVNVNFHVNNYACFPQALYPADAFEVTLINKNLIKKKSESRSFNENKLNNRNTPNPGRDCLTSDQWEQTIKHIDNRYPYARKNKPQFKGKPQN